MNRTLISKESVLSVAKEIMVEKSLNELTMRNVAIRCNVAVGSIYNYFPSKSDLIISTIESIWKEITGEMQEINKSCSFVESVSLVLCEIDEGCRKYPDFFSIHLFSASSVDLEKAQKEMNQYVSRIKLRLMESLDRDLSVKADVFTQSFSKNDFIDFVFLNIISLLMQKQGVCTALLEVVSRIIY